MFAEALAEASSSNPPPLKRVESDDAPAPRPRRSRPHRRRRDRRGAPQRGRGPKSVASPFCSITFVDESGTFDGEGDILPPWRTPPRRRLRRSPRPRRHPDPTHRRLAAVARGRIRRRRRGVRRSRHRGRVPRQGVHPRGATPCTRRLSGGAARLGVRPRSKCVGLCSAACVVRVTEATMQTVHTRVNPTNAAVVVLPGRSYGGGGASPFSRASEAERSLASVDDVEPSGPSLPWSPPRKEIPIPAAAGFLAAAKAAVERGAGVEDSAGEGRAKIENRKSRKSRRASGAVAAAAAASRRGGARGRRDVRFRRGEGWA